MPQLPTLSRGTGPPMYIDRMNSELSALGPGRRIRSLILLLAIVLPGGCGGDSVAPTQATEVALVPQTALLIGVGEVVRFAASPRDSGGDPISGAEVTWSVSDGSVADVDGNGLLTARGSGTVTVTAASGSASGTAHVEVFVPEEVSEYVVGGSYTGRRGYVEYIPGDLPVVLSAPHGGDLRPSEIPDRTLGVTTGDRNTRELTLAVRDALEDLTGMTPHVIISHLHRSKLDPNREIVEAAQDNPEAEQAWREFQEWIAVARQEVGLEFERGMYFDMHGHGHDVDRLELGYLLSTSDLNREDISLNSLSFVAQSSIRDIGRESPLLFSQLLRGPTSFGGLLQAEGVRSVPSPSDPAPGTDAYFSGGYNTRQHGSQSDGEVISGIQIEHHFPGLRDTDANRRAYAARLARVIRDYMLDHFGFFTTPIG